MLGWLVRLLDRQAGPAASLLAGVDSRPDGPASGIPGLAGRHPLAFAATGGLILAGFTVAPIDGIVARKAPRAVSLWIGRAEFEHVPLDQRRCLYRIGEDSWAVRKECREAGLGDSATRREGGRSD